MAVLCYATIRRCPQCARNRIELRKNVKQLPLFPTTAPLESVSIGRLGEFTRSTQGNIYLLLLTDRFTKMVKRIPMEGVSVTEFARHFVHHWVFNYGPPTNLLAEKGGSLTSTFLQDVWKLMDMYSSFTTIYHLQANGQVEQYSRTIFAALPKHVADHPRDWGQYTDALTYE